MQPEGSEVKHLYSPAIMPGKAKPIDRISYLCNRASGKNVLYIGPREQLRLRNSLRKITTSFHDFDEADIHDEKFNPDAATGYWDIIILDGVLERAERPLHLLTSIREQFNDYASEIIIAAPNVMSINFPFTRNEKPDTGQFYWFSPFTLNRMLVKAGFTPQYHDYLIQQPLTSGRFKKLVTKYLLSRKPAFRQTLIYTAKF